MTASCGYGSRVALRLPGTTVSILTARFSPELCKFVAPSEQRAQGRPGADCARELRVQRVVRRRTRSNRYSQDSPAFPAQWLYGLYVLSPVSGVVCHRRKVGLTTRLTPRSRRQNHTTSPYALGVFVGPARADLTPQASIATRATFRDDREAPLMAARAGRIDSRGCVPKQSIIPIFRSRFLTTVIV
jgi:hypothetical protein